MGLEPTLLLRTRILSPRTYVRVRPFASWYVAYLRRKLGLHKVKCPAVSCSVPHSIATALLPLLPRMNSITSPIRRGVTLPSALSSPRGALPVMVLLPPGYRQKHAATAGTLFELYPLGYQRTKICIRGAD